MLIISASAGFCAEQDKRVVNGAVVDIGPVHEWFAEKKGERPLKHWQRLRLTAVDENKAGWNPCSVQGEDGHFSRRMISNLPPEIVDAFQKRTAIEAKLLALREQVVADKAADKKATRYYRDASGELVTSTSRGIVADTPGTREARVLSIRDRIEDNLKNIGDLEHQLAEVEKETKNSVVFAMFTGQKYSNLEIWDCGKKAR